MGIVLGFILLFCFCLLLAKVITRKLHLKKADRFLMKIHKPICTVAVICCVLHIVFVFPVLKTRSIYVLLTGIVLTIVMVLMILFCHIMKKKELRLRWHRILSATMLIMIVCHIVVYTIDFQEYQKKISNIQIDGIDASELADGTYVGNCDVGYIYAQVEVTVQKGKITNIEIVEHRNERGEPAEKIVDEIVKEQSTDVDAISGATNSSKVIKKAVEEALEN